jgi:ABC-2 type transport system ATP-binding protein
MLVRAGIRVAELTPERRTLEEIVIDVTTASSDRLDAPSPGRPDAAGREDRS